MRLSPNLALVAALLCLPGCFLPDLEMVYVRPSKLPSAEDRIRYDFAVQNLDYRGNLFIRPTDAVGPVTVQAYLSSDGRLRDGGPAGGLVIVPSGSVLARGATLPESFQATPDLDPAHPFLILEVRTSATQMDLRTSNNSLAAIILTASPANLEQWLIEHPYIKRNLKWEQPGGAVVGYDDWDPALKALLQSHVNGMVSGTPIAVTDPPPLAVVPSGAAYPETTFTPDTARTEFIAHVARSIVSEEQLPWKTSELSDAELAHLFDSRRLFHWNASRGAYFRHWADFGRVTPGDPSTVYAFMQSNGLIGATRLETIEKVLDWSRALVHYLDGDTADNYYRHWQYTGNPPVSRILSGTVRVNDQLFARYTAGCWGTSGLLWLMLRTVNIPADFTINGSHALPRFIHEDLHLSHGDDPYAIRTATWIPIGELPIGADKYDAWFGPTVPFEQQSANVGRRVCELDAQYLTDELVRLHCADVADGVSHEASRVYGRLKKCYTLPELDQMDLWARLDARAVERGFCSP